MSNDKVYCRKCRFFKSGIEGEKCMESYVWEHSYLRKWKKYDIPGTKNKNNDCKVFKPPKTIKEFFETFKRIFHGT